MNVFFIGHKSGLLSVDIDSKVKQGKACARFFGFIETNWEGDLSQRKRKETVNTRT